jgi:predicted ArsR family transcriptional regulator
MDTTQFDHEVGALTASLGDTTRRGIYIAAREAPEPVTAAEVAKLFSIHPNVARHHLDRLVDDGYLQVSHRRRPGRRGPGAGRPAKHYEPTDKDVAVQFPARRYDLLAELLARVVERLAPEGAAEIAQQVGMEYGRELAAEIGIPADAGYEAATIAVAKAMMGVGFGTEAKPGDHLLVTHFCPFGETAAKHPELVCKLDQGIVRGLMEAAHQEPIAIVSPHDAPDEDCLTEL